MVLHTVEDGKPKQIETDFLGSRFFYSEIGKAPSPLYNQMNGWLLMGYITEVVLYYRPFCVVEIGAGESTKVLANAAQKAGVKLYSCDKSPRKNVIYFERHEFHQVFSDDFMKTFTDTPAVVLIDADHHYDVAKREFDFFFERLVEGGVIFLHDTYAPHEKLLNGRACGDVYRLRQDLEKREDLDCLTWPYGFAWMGLTQVIKKEKNRPYWGQ